MESFIDSIGVAVHLNYGDTAYRNYEDLIKPRLVELGIRHIRGGVAPEDEKILERFRDLGKMGIRSTIVMDPRRVSDASQAVQLAKSLQGSIEAVEGPNEWDIHPELTYGGQPFPEGVRRFQAELYQAIKSDPATRDLTVLSPSMARSQNIGQLGQVACNVGNMHSYPGGKKPTELLYQKWVEPAQTLCPNHLIAASETGYHNAINKPEKGHQPGVSELAAAKYTTRLVLEYFNRGIQRAYSYELIDLKPNPEHDQPNLNYGLLRSDGTRKSDFVAVRNLIQILQDVSEITDVSQHQKHPSPSYTLEGEDYRTRSILLEGKRNAFYLILWQDVSSFDLEQKKDLQVPEQEITIVFEPKVSQAFTYLPIDSIEPKSSFSQRHRLSVEVPDHPLIVKLVNFQ
ncbi:MAG: hypothetical protein ACFBSC_08790 [Microcoleaceae cyanobacterium]